MNANLLRRVNWLWKHRHTHDDDNVQEQITIIRQTVEAQSEAGGPQGAYIHLNGSAQTVDAAGEPLEWDEIAFLDGRHEFVTPTFPATSVTIPVSGYYNVKVDFDWDGFSGGGTVWVVRTRDGISETVYPSLSDPGVWSSTIGSMFVEVAHAIPCRVGDELSVWVDPGGTNQDLITATLDVYLVDRLEGSPLATADPGLVDSVASFDEDIVTTHQITMTTAQSSGDLMLMLLNSQTFTWSAYPAGWTALVDNFLYGTSNHFMSLLYKVSDGTETDVTADTSDTCMSAHAVWVVQSGVDYSSNAPTAATPVQATPPGHPTIDPPAVTPVQGAGNYLIFPLVVRNGGGVPVSDGPDGFDMLVNTYDVGPFGSSEPALEVFQAALAVTTSVDPTSITWSTTWTGELLGSTTVAVRI